MNDSNRFYDYLAKLELNGLRNTWIGNRFKIHYVLRRSLRFLRRDFKVLEVGVGEGYLLLLLKRWGFEVYGVDLSPFLVEVLGNKLWRYRIKVLCYDIARFDVNSLGSKFDAIFALDVLEHIPDLHKALDNIKQLLREGGYFIGTLPLGERPYENIMKCPRCGEVFHKWGHVHFFERPHVIWSYLSPNFKVVEYGFVPPNTMIERIKELIRDLAGRLKLLETRSVRTLYFIAERK